MSKRRTHTAVASLALMAPLLAASCAHKTVATGRFAVLAERAAAAPLTADEILNAPTRHVYAPWDTSDDRRLIVQRVESPTQPGFLERRYIAAGPDQPPQPLLERRFDRLADGAIILLEEVNHAENVIVDFDPPLIVMPASMKSDVPHEQKVRMIVHPIGDPSRIRAQGPASHTSTLIGQDTVRTPAGPVAAAHIRSVLHASLSLVSVINESDQWFAPDIGLLAEKRVEKTRLIFTSVKTEDWVLDEPAAEPVSTSGG